jgi:hypothetical protein
MMQAIWKTYMEEKWEQEVTSLTPSVRLCSRWLTALRRDRQCTYNVTVRCIRVMFILPRLYRGADKFLARPTSWCILFDGENISFDASLVTYK